MHERLFAWLSGSCCVASESECTEGLPEGKTEGCCCSVALEAKRAAGASQEKTRLAAAARCVMILGPDICFIALNHTGCRLEMWLNSS